LLQGRVDLVGSELSEPLLEKMNAELDVEIFLLQIVNVLG
jgi:hypothetical protein